MSKNNENSNTDSVDAELREQPSYSDLREQIRSLHRKHQVHVNSDFVDDLMQLLTQARLHSSGHRDDGVDITELTKLVQWDRGIGYAAAAKLIDAFVLEHPLAQARKGYVPNLNRAPDCMSCQGKGIVKEGVLCPTCNGWGLDFDNAEKLFTQAELDQAKQEAYAQGVKILAWRIDCSTLISELSGWRGCVEMAQEQAMNMRDLYLTNPHTPPQVDKGEA